MTSIESQVTRRSRFPFANYGKDNKRIVATLHTEGSQGDFLTLRLERRREGYSIDLVDLLSLLIRDSVRAKQREKRREKMKFKVKKVKRY